MLGLPTVRLAAEMQGRLSIITASDQRLMDFLIVLSKHGWKIHTIVRKIFRHKFLLNCAL